MPDLRVLGCPSQPIGTLSYDIIFPASNAEFRAQVYGEVEGLSLEDVDRRVAHQRVPMIIEQHDCSESGGRNVLFTDGHAEWISDRD